MPIRGKTNKKSAKISPYTKLTQTIGPTSGGQKPKGRKNSTFFKEIIQLSLKPGKMRLQTQSVQFSQSCQTLCDPMNFSIPGLPVHHQLPEFTQTHVHRVGDAIQPPPLLLPPSMFPSIRVFSNESALNGINIAIIWIICELQYKDYILGF